MRLCLAYLMITLCLTGAAYASSTSFSVTCSIPAIPGVNAPIATATAAPATLIAQTSGSLTTVYDR
jgi:hypothetical protein